MRRVLNVWILQTGEPLHIDSGFPRPMRAMNLANALVVAGHNVTVFSSDFSHGGKKHRFGGYREITVGDNLKYRLIPSPGYRSHVGFRRVIDHWVMGRNFRAILMKERSRPDVAFVGFPPIEVGYYFSGWLRARKIPFLLDIKDQWPDIFMDPLPLLVRPLARFLLWPYFYMTRMAMRRASGISSVAQSFLTWALEFSDRSSNVEDRVVPLTSPQILIENDAREAAYSFWRQKGITADRTKVVFIGTQSKAFDIMPVVNAARYFNRNSGGVDFIICGDGPRTLEWQRAFGDIKNVFFPGWINNAQIKVLLENSLAVLAPYYNNMDFMKSIPNKIVDGLANGKPILTGLRGEVEVLVKTERVGLFYGGEDKNLEHCIEALIAHPELKAELESNAIRVYRDRFDSANVYEGLVDHLALLASKG